MVGKKSGAFPIFVHVVMILLVLICLYPFAIMFMSSISSEASLIRHGYNLFPSEIGFDAYDYLLKRPMLVIRSYGVTLISTAVGTVLGLFMSIFLAYGLSLRDLPGRSAFAFYVFFTMLFSGGLVPTYIMWSQWFHIKNTIWALIVPRLMVNAFQVIVMRSYFQSNIPDEIKEAARIDGANEFRILFQIVLPISTPIIATIGLMIALGYWNDWMNGLYYVTDSKLFSVQQLLNRILADAQYLSQNTDSVEVSTNIPTNSLKMALAAVGSLPLMLLLPFFQKYYVKGMTIGAVKG